MTLKTIVLSLLLCILAVPALAVTENPATSADILSACHTTEECIVAEALCPNRWSAINKKHEADHRAMTTQRRPQVQCPEADPLAKKPDSATCVDNKCELTKNMSVPELPSMFECAASEDCVVTEGICPGWWIAVNKVRVSEQEDIVKKARPVVKCKPPISPDKPVSAFCVEKECTVKKPDAKP